MKQHLFVCLSLFLLAFLTACGTGGPGPVQQDPLPPEDVSTPDIQDVQIDTPQNSDTEQEKTMNPSKKVRFLADGNEIIVAEELYLPHPIVGAIDRNPEQGVMLLDEKK